MHSISKYIIHSFIKKATDRGTSEFRQLYFFLLKCFTEADKDRNGSVDVYEFDRMVETAVEAPRRFGLAPTSQAMFKNDAERLAVRMKDFERMDTNNSGTITFDEWLIYAADHITAKAATL